MKLSSNSRRQLRKAFVPEEVTKDGHKGKLKASFHASSGILNVYPIGIEETNEDNLFVGRCVASKDCVGNYPDEDFLIYKTSEDEWEVAFKDEYYEVQLYELVQSVFSRNSGLIESKQMASTHVVIFGCGSVGSLAALELARVGVGNFLLVDNDILEYHNICRHQCGIHEVGEYKVDAIKRRILDINPTANVKTYTTLAEYIPKEAWEYWVGKNHSLCLACADNREADVYISDLCLMFSSPFLSIGFWERAFAGELFYWLPESNMVCYRCALGDGSLNNSSSMSRRLYTTQAEPETIHFEPGIAVDIDFVTNIGVKLAIDILNSDNPSFTQRLLPHLQQYTLACNTNNPKIGGEIAEIFSYPLQVTTSLKVKSKEGCPCFDSSDSNV